MGSGSFARVLTGWTGTAALVAAGTTVTVTPHTRESVASFVARLVAEVVAQTALTLSVSVSSAGVVTLSSTVAFDLTLTGTVATRTAWTAGPYSSVTSVVGTGAFANAWVPANGIRLADPLLSTTRGGFTADDGFGVAPWRVSTASRIVALDSGLSLPDLAGYENDYWHDGRLWGRVVATGVRRVPMSSRLRSTTTTRIEIDVLEVA